MMRRHFTFLGLIILVILQSCAPLPYQTPTPYPGKEFPPPADERDSSQTDITEPPEEPAAQKKSPLISDLSRQADRQMHSGQLQAAAQTLERGLRIAPKDASLWSQLADIRLRQHLYGQALSLAAKSNSLAGGNAAIIDRNQRIIEQARKEQN